MQPLGLFRWQLLKSLIAAHDTRLASDSDQTMLCGHAFSTLCLSAACLLACTFPCACASSSGYAIHTVTDAATPFGSAHATLNHLVLEQTLHEKNETSHFLPPLRGVIVRPSSLSLGKAKKVRDGDCPCVHVCRAKHPGRGRSCC